MLAVLSESVGSYVTFVLPNWSAKAELLSTWQFFTSFGGGHILDFSRMFPRIKQTIGPYLAQSG